MTRPKRPCKVSYTPKIQSFLPEQVAQCDLQSIELSCAEVEALRLKNLKNLNQTAGAAQMGISQSTFQRLLSSAYKKITEAVIMGKAIRLSRKQD